MNITALIKISAEIPHGAISQATGEYLLSMAEAEREHNARVAFLSERGSRVASQPSKYWQRAYSALKFATQGFDVSEHFLYLELSSHKAPRFEGSLEGLSKLASENEALKRLANIGQIKQQDRTQERVQKTKKQKGKGKATDKKIDRFLRVENPNTEEGQRKMLSKLRIIKKKLIDPQEGSDFSTKLLKRVYGLIGKDQGMKQKLTMLRAQWDTKKKESVQISYRPLNGNQDRKTSIKIENLTDNTRGKNKSKNTSLISAKLKAWEEVYGEHLDDVLALARKAMQKQKASGQGAKKEEGSKSEGAKADGAPKKEEGSGSEGAKKEKPKTDAEKIKDFLDGAESPQQRKERQELVQKEGIEGATAIAFGGDQEEETAVGESLDVGEVSAEQKPDDGSGLSAKDFAKGAKDAGIKGSIKDAKKWKNNNPEGTYKQYAESRTASEEDFLSSESPSDYSSVDFDIIF